MKFVEPIRDRKKDRPNPSQLFFEQIVEKCIAAGLVWGGK
jgi:hypothetical protein